MRFSFDKAACQNTRRALRKEWLLTNGLGDYAGSSILCCNTRKYHGLLTVNTPLGRHVLLSALEESVMGGGKEFFLSTRQHPRTLYPHGHEYLESFRLDQWPEFTYRVGDVRLRREMFLIHGTSRLLLRWSIQGLSKLPPLTLRIKPLLAYRHFHALTRANSHLRVRTQDVPRGFSITPYEGLPTLYMQVRGPFTFLPSPDWFHNVEYMQERERGFPDSEDLFQPGILDIPLPPLPEGGSVYMAVGTEPVAEDGEDLEAIWEAESRARTKAHHNGGGLIGHLAQMGRQFCIETPSGRPAVLAGYHWFDAWGRDTLISLPGLAFYGDRTEFGLRVLEQVAGSLKNGLTPNCFAEDGNHAYNSADASLWYVWAVQQMLKALPDRKRLVRERCWPVIKNIIEHYGGGKVPFVTPDAEGFLSVGNPGTQLTWMDAVANGRPVTPRHGQPVEISALWYNALAFADSLAKAFGEPEWRRTKQLDAMRAVFFKRYWVTDERGDYLADVWRDGGVETCVRPNQLFALSLPYPVLDEERYVSVLSRVRRCLLTPYGLRTLAPSAPGYRPLYEGGPAERDEAYHQGTVWPWLLGAYGEAVLRAAWDVPGSVRELLRTIRPLFAQHLGDAGIGSVSEIFDGDPPHLPNGCIAQAWSVAECLRLLYLLKEAAPGIYAEWEANARKGGN